jgi:hypothetical protein
MRQKFFSINGDEAILDWFYFYSVVFFFIRQSFLADMDNMLEESKRIWRIRQEYFAALNFGLSRQFFDLSQKNQVLRVHNRMGKKTHLMRLSL